MLPKGVTRNTSKGRVYYRYRRAGFNYTFKNKPGTPDFLQELDECLLGTTPGLRQEIPGSIAALIARYYVSPLFKDLKQSTQINYRGILERFKSSYGDQIVIGLKPAHIRAIMEGMSNRPMAANNLLKKLRVIMRYAQELDMRPDNPCDGVRLYKQKGQGHHTWDETEIAAYEAQHPIGTTARLALDLLLYTAQRRSDAVTLGWQHVKGGNIAVRQIKTGEMVDIPLHPRLKKSLEQTKGNMTFLLTKLGKPFTANGFGNKMRQWCDEAGLSACASHGLRKAAARRLAEAGCTTNEIMSITGHRTSSEVDRYTRDANRVQMAENAANKLSNFRPGWTKT